MINTQPILFADDKYNEKWVPLFYPGVELGEYLISSMGNVYDLINNRYLSQHVSKSNGYVYVSLRHAGSVLVHRLVAINFIPRMNIEQVQVNHKDGIKTHNYDYNLEWNTPKENTNHAFDTGLAYNNIGERSHLAKLTNDQATKICQLLSDGLNYKQILAEIGIEITPNNMDMIGNIYRRIAWTHISKDYTFPDHDNRFRVNSKDRIELICRCIESGMTNREVYEYIHQKPLKISKETKQDYELIRLIRNKRSFTDISSNYNF